MKYIYTFYVSVHYLSRLLFFLETYDITFLLRSLKQKQSEGDFIFQTASVISIVGLQSLIYQHCLNTDQLQM